MMQTEDRTNLETFEALFLSLGPDVVKLDGSRHDAELMTAKASAAGRWLRLQQLEAQVEREAAILAARPKERGYAPGDEFRPTRWLRRVLSSPLHDSLVEQAAAYLT